jgi:hypothetical protein
LVMEKFASRYKALTKKEVSGPKRVQVRGRRPG